MNKRAWEIYAITLRLLAPLHVGWRKVGNLQQTRYYLLGSTLWGALTARLARMQALSTGVQANYKAAGEDIDRGMRFSYFYPVDDCLLQLNCIEKKGWPWELGSAFEWKFPGSFTGSPTGHDRQVTTDGGLHETEYIMPYTREGKQVYLKGYVVVKRDQGPILSRNGSLSGSLMGGEGNTVIHKLFNHVQLGGERSYGWGRVTVEKCEALEGDKVEFFGCRLESDNREHLYVVLPEGAYLPAHMCVKGTGNEAFINHIEGQLEVMNGRLTKSADRFGRDFGDGPEVFWAPGSRTTRELRIEIKERGKLVYHTPDTV